MKFRTHSFLLFLILLLNKHACSTTYYISSSTGNDLNSGSQSVSPWQTLNRLNNQIIVAGDSILLKCGDTFFGTIILNSSGNISAPIYFGKYSNGSLPVISGFKKLTNWTNIGNIYIANDSGNVRSIWYNNNWMKPARFPNNGFFQTLFDGLNTAVYAPYLNQTSVNWNEAYAIVRSAGFKYERVKVDTFDQGFVYFENPVSSNIPVYNGFYFENYLAALDTSNEWFCDTSTNQILLIPPVTTDISLADIDASVLDFGFICNPAVNHIIIDSLSFTGQAIDAIRFSNSTVGIKLLNCQFNKIKQHAINFLQLTNSTEILNNVIQDCGGDAVYGYFFTQSKISGNNILRTGINTGFGMDDVYRSQAIYCYISSNTSISDNIIDSVAYAGIDLNGYSNKLERNYIKNSMLNLEGGGAIVLNGYFFLYGNLIKDNFLINIKSDVKGTSISNPISAGILMNYFCTNDTILHNTIDNADSYGIYFSPYNQNHLLKDNVFYNNQRGQVFITDGDTLNATKNIELKQNILYSLSEKQKVIEMSGNSFDFFPIKGDSNYYCNPYDHFPIYQHTKFDTINEEKPFSVAFWNQTTTQDSNSHSSGVHWQNYFATDTSGSDLITNGNFTNNYDQWISEPTDNNSLLLDNLTMMDGGCIKFEVTGIPPFDKAKIVSSVFSLFENQFYEMSYSSSGLSNGILQSNISIQTPPYGVTGFNKYFPIETFRNDVSYIFQASHYENPVALNFELHKTDSLVYFDNIHLFPVNVFKHDSTRMSVLLMNYSPNTVSVPLGADSVFRDLDGNIVTGSYTLNPYSSYVLVLDSPLNLVSVKEIQKQNSITVYPNPVQSATGKIVVQLPDENKYDYEVYDLTGRKFLTGKFSGSGINSFSMKNASAGIYILSVHSANKLCQQKIVVVN